MLTDSDLVRRPTTAVISRSALRSNLAFIARRIGPERQIMAVVKANAYGHGLIETARTLVDGGAHRLGVAFLEEGIALRRAGLSCPILVLGGLIGNQVRHFLEHDLELCGASPHKLRQIDTIAAEMGVRAKVHLLVDTGMERLGIHAETACRLLEAAASASCVDVVGVFSHLARSEEPDPSPTLRQLERFGTVLDRLSDFGLEGALKHIANSGGVLHHGEDLWLDMVRPGLALYGVGPRGPVDGLQPAMRLESRVVYFKVVPAGAGVGYGATWHAPCDTRLATVPIGYGDGYPRALSNRGQLGIRGQLYPVVGTVTMDATMVDLGPKGTAYNEDGVLVFGRDGGLCIPVEAVARAAGTIPYEILCAVSPRVPRFYVDEAL